MKKKYVALVMAMALAAMTGCGSGSQGSTTTTTAAATEAATEAAETPETEAEKTEAEKTEEAVSGSGDASASTWPSGTVQIYVPASAGGGSDMIVRLFAQAMTEKTGANFVVVNDSTGGGTVAAETVRNAKPDGLNLYSGHTGLCGSIAIGQYDHTYEDFQMLGTITVPGVETNVICVNSSLSYETFEELLEDARENPGKLLVGVQANGNRHFMQMLLQKATDTEFTIVDCGGVADTITNLVGGMIDMAILPINNARQYIEAGDLRALAITGDNRSEVLTEVPTMKECGYDSAEISSVQILAGPLGMSADDVAKINLAMKEVLEDEEVIAQYKQMAMEAGYNTPEDAAALVAEYQELYNKAAEEMN